MKAYQGVIIERHGSRWHTVVALRWPHDAPYVEWLRRARQESGLAGTGGRGYPTREAICAAIDTAIRSCGTPPMLPVMPELWESSL